MSISPENQAGETITPPSVPPRGRCAESVRSLERDIAAAGGSAGMGNNNGDGRGLEAIKRALLLKRSELLRHQTTQLSALYTPDKHHLADLEEMSPDTVDTESLCALVDLGSHTLEQIDAALEKIEEGTYGACELCEQPISRERLEVLPFAALCISCQRRKEEEA